ncbi:E2/UBC family protein [Halococcus sp. PRR34]|uniref:E2/UBC family protein n=1 Tax=Halococcus sp. PRR34 TaxID=3020830 RepID=UPI002361EFFD|nr:E2/UBC family protein [Halococcus sp. PRR34]
MSSDDAHSDGSEEEPADQPDYETLEKLVQRAQDAHERAESFFTGHDNVLNSIDDGLEEVEDTIDEAQDSNDADILAQADPFIDDVQRAARHLEDQVDFSTDPEETADVVNSLDNSVEDLEDALETERKDQLIVKVSHRTFVPDEYVMEPDEILEEAGFDRADYLLYYGVDAEEEDPHIEKETEVDLREHHVFTAIPDETGYGGTAPDEEADDNSKPNADLPAGLAHEVADLREDYDVDVDTEAEGQYVWVIVRDYPVPSDTYNKNQTDTLIRVPENYPEQPPDWVYVDEDFRLANGNVPKNGNRYEDNPSARDILEGWMSLSWHIRSLSGVKWIPYETGLRWYLDTIVRGRLRTGE